MLKLETRETKYKLVSAGASKIRNHCNSQCDKGRGAAAAEAGMPGKAGSRSGSEAGGQEKAAGPTSSQIY